MEKINKVVIIGSGPAGLTAAIYTARAGLNPVVLAGIEFGGQLMTTTKIDNFPGFPEGIDGAELMQNMIKQAERFGAEIVYALAERVDFTSAPFKLITSNNEYLADSVIIAVGSSPRRIGLESEKKFWGRGVSTCATCDGAFYKDKKVAVIGGGDSAMEEASFLSTLAQKVYVIHRKDQFRASAIMQQRVMTNPKIEVIWNTEIKEIQGEQTVKSLSLKNNQTNEESTLEVDGMFLAIGHIPQTNFLKGQINLDDHGYIVSHDDVKTSVDGVFVAGDVKDPIYQQAITAAGMGCKAALKAQKYLEGMK